MPERRFQSKIAGVTFRNPDGADRQKIVARCRVGDPLELVAEANRHDPNAMVLYHRRRGLFGSRAQVGYLPAVVGAGLAREIRSGDLDPAAAITIRIGALTGGTPDKPTRAVTIEITITEPT